MYESAVLQKIIQNTGWLVAETIGMKALRFFVGVWMVRYLGPENYGTYSYAVSIAAILQTFTTLGLNQIVIRECSREKYESDRVLITAFWLRGIAAVVVIATLAVVLFQVDDDWLTRTAVLIVSAGMFFNTSLIADLWFQSQIQAKYSVYTRTVANVTAAGLQVIAILAGANVLVFLAIFTVQSVVQAIGFAFMIRRRGPSLTQILPSMALSVKLLKDSWPLMIAAFSTMVYMKIDQIMLKNMAGQSDVGIYASAVKLSELWYFIPVAIANSVFPEIVQSRENLSTSEFMSRTQTFYDLMAGLAYVVAVPVSLAAPYVVPIILGAEYTAASYILQIHVWSFIFIALGVARGKWLVAENLTKYAMMATVVGAATNVGLNLFLIPMYGGGGAAWATLSSYAVYAYVTLALPPATREAFVQLSKAIVAPIRYIPWLRR